MLDKSEQETIINFNKEEKVAHIFTYEKTWQRHLEQRLGCKPTMDNGIGGRGYEVDKKRIKMPRAPRKKLKKSLEAIYNTLEVPKKALTRAKPRPEKKK